jgi:trk system potassium uptake protein
MLFRPSQDDFRLIGLYTGKVLYGVGGAMVVPLLVALFLGERNEVSAFVIGAALAVIAGATSQLLLRTDAPLRAGHGLSIVALAWILAPVFGAVPLLLSGHYLGYLDAYFEAMSGFATIGLTLANDLDHMARSVNLWRHLMHLLGGQGIVIVVLTIFASAGGAAGNLYTGEGEKERILPNVVHTGAFILRVVATYGALGITALWAALVAGGMPPVTAVFHAVTLFITVFDTAGFAPMSASASFYRSATVEAVLMLLMVAGAFSFALHYQLWRRRTAELARNLETRTAALSTLAVFFVMALGLSRTGTFTEAMPLWRHGFFQTLSAHTTTGLSTVPGGVFVSDWGVLAPAMLVAAMAIGGMAGSTAGGIKLIRIGLLVKALQRDTRRVLLPPDAVVLQTYQSGGKRLLRDEQVRGAATILLLFLLVYLGGGMLGLFFGYDLNLALFESTAAAATGGLSVGLVRPELEWQLKLVYIVQMLVGRLEFIAVLAFGGYIVSVFRGRV